MDPSGSHDPMRDVYKRQDRVRAGCRRTSHTVNRREVARCKGAVRGRDTRAGIASAGASSTKGRTVNGAVEECNSSRREVRSSDDCDRVVSTLRDGVRQNCRHRRVWVNRECRSKRVRGAIDISQRQARRSARSRTRCVQTCSSPSSRYFGYARERKVSVA